MASSSSSSNNVQYSDMGWENFPSASSSSFAPTASSASLTESDFMFIEQSAPASAASNAGPDSVLCPICDQSFLPDLIEEHVILCLSNTAPVEAASSSSRPVEDAMHVDQTDFDYDRRRQEREREEAENYRLLQEMLRQEQEEERLAQQRSTTLAKSACTCVLCRTEQSLDTVFFLDGCDHSYCRPCLHRTVMQHVEAATPSRATCVVCSCRISERDVREIVSTDEYSRYEKATLREIVQNSSGQFIQCPNRECGSVIERLSSDTSRIDEKELGPNGQPLSRELLVHKSQFRFRCRDCGTEFCAGCNTVPYHLGYTCAQFACSKSAKHCRFCDADLPAEATDTTCQRDECRDKLKRSCAKTLPCGHMCRGVAGEQACMPCLDAECASKRGDTQAADDYCNICWVESLAAAPSIRLKCGHVFHSHCCKQKLERRWPTPAISFNFATCPLCKEPMEHPALRADLEPLVRLQEDIKQRTIVRMQIEGLDKEYSRNPALKTKYPKPEDYGLHVFAYYMCFTCKKPYFGGKKSCVGAMDENAKFKPSDLVCGACSGDQADCKRHGKDYIEYKCRFCCGLATFFCGGQAHFCTPCHTKAGELVEFSKWTTIKKCPDCPGPEKCPLGVSHPPNGTEAALGCAMCRAENLIAAPVSSPASAPAPAAAPDVGPADARDRNKKQWPGLFGANRK